MKEYILLNRKTQPGFNGTRYTRFTWYCWATGKLYETTVDETYGNYIKNGWRDMCEDDQPYGSYTNLKPTNKTTKTGTPIITADSKPNLLQRFPSKETAQQVVTARAQELNQI